MIKYYLSVNGEILANTLQDADYLDAATPLLPTAAVIADADLPTPAVNEALIVTGSRNADGHYTVSDNAALAPDYRNTAVYNKTSGQPVRITTIGELPQTATLLSPPSRYHRFDHDQERWSLPQEQQQQQLNDAVTAAGDAIDTAVAGIYALFQRFEMEYTLREAQAQAFKDANYSGDMPSQVAAYAAPAGLTPQAATDDILSQAARLRAALDSLGQLRMGKVGLAHLDTMQAVQTRRDELLAQIAAIGEQL